MKNTVIAITILSLFACKSVKEMSTQPIETITQKNEAVKLLFTAQDEEQWKVNFYSDNSSTLIRFGDTVINRTEMTKKDQMDGLPTVYQQLSDNQSYYFEIENSRCMKDNESYERSITVFYNGEALQGCLEGVDNSTNYYDKWNLVDIPGLDKSRIYGMMNRPYVILNQEEGLINGSTGCNIFNGNFEGKAKKTGFGRLMMTKRGCNDAEIESAIVNRIENSNRVERKDINLYFYQGDDAVLIYRLAE
jgi:uncharacterized membrane protein